MENKPVTSMYSKTPAYIYGFHGCTKEVYDKVIYQNQPMKKSDNAYDWLGNGIYFWENSYQRDRIEQANRLQMVEIMA